MNKQHPQIYGLEFQARSLTSQQHESDVIRFMVGTQSLKLSQNQVHIIEISDDNSSSKTTICSHDSGEVWHIAASPHSPDIISTVYNTTEENVCTMKSSIWRLTEGSLELQTNLPLDEHGHDVKQTWFHPTDSTKVLSIVDNHYLVWDLAENAKLSTKGSLSCKGQPRFTCGKWNPHHNVTQVATANEGTVRGWDLRSSSQAWGISESAHCHLLRDFDFNPNRQYYLATCGDDGFTRFWDIRNADEPLVSRCDHSHWVWTVRFNHFHDQLILTSSSDSRVVLSCVSGISSEPVGHTLSGDEDEPTKDKLEDGVICRYDEHEDSVYAVEWSHSDPWTFASLSYDGRLVINTVPRSHKYKILL